MEESEFEHRLMEYIKEEIGLLEFTESKAYPLLKEIIKETVEEMRKEFPKFEYPYQEYKREIEMWFEKWLK